MTLSAPNAAGGECAVQCGDSVRGCSEAEQVNGSRIQASAHGVHRCSAARAFAAVEHTGSGHTIAIVFAMHGMQRANCARDDADIMCICDRKCSRMRTQIASSTLQSHSKAASQIAVNIIHRVLLCTVLLWRKVN
jgi:hypothetical protein